GVFGLVIAGLAVVVDFGYTAQAKLGDDVGRQREQNKILSAQLDQANSRIADLKSQVEITTQRMGLTQSELAKAKSRAEDIRKEQQASDQELTTQIKASQEQIGAVASEVGERIEYNLKSGTGVVHEARSSVSPYYRIDGERMERLGESRYHVRRGVFTTCESDPPAWSFRFREADVDLEEGLVGRGAAFWVDSIPLLPVFPFFAAAIRRERQTGFLFPRFGSSSFKGAFLELPFYWAIADNVDATVTLSEYTKRGTGGSAEARYIISDTARGNAAGFFVKEYNV